MKGMIKYEVIIYWSSEDQAFIAEVPELPGCAADGATYREALSNLEVVIQEWLETAKEMDTHSRAQRPAGVCVVQGRPVALSSSAKGPSVDVCRNNVEGWA